MILVTETDKGLQKRSSVLWSEQYEETLALVGSHIGHAIGIDTATETIRGTLHGYDDFCLIVAPFGIERGYLLPAWIGDVCETDAAIEICDVQAIRLYEI